VPDWLGWVFGRRCQAPAATQDISLVGHITTNRTKSVHSVTTFVTDSLGQRFPSIPNSTQNQPVRGIALTDYATEYIIMAFS
jgi:hypothetical protein